jgi:nitric oxide reductase NorD protein
MSIIPLTENELEEALENRLEDPAFDMPFMLGSLAKPAQQLALFHRTQQNFILACATRVAAIHEQIAYQFVLHAAQALKRLGEEGIDKWLVHIMDIYDVSGIFPAIKAIKGLEDYERFTRIQSYGVLFSEVERILNSFVNGLSGRQLICTSHDEMYTDTETLYLPDVLGKFDNKKDNFRLYKAMVGHLWAQTWYGSFPLELPEYLTRFENTEKALCCFQALETLRLDACLSRDLPGLHREMQTLQEKITKNLRG